MGNTVTALYGRTVMGAATERSRLSTDTVGHVGPDAHLDDAVVKVVFTHRHAERGVQVDATATATIDVQRSVAATLRGTPSVDVKIRVAGASAREERAAVRDYAAQSAADPDLRASFRKDAAHARSELADAESTWYDLPNGCTEIHFDPDTGAELAPGQDLPVGAQITTRDGQPATGTLAVQTVTRGGFSLVSGAFDPTTPARFRAHGIDPDDYGATAAATVIGTSTAGRADCHLHAAGPLPQARRLGERDQPTR